MAHVQNDDLGRHVVDDYFEDETFDDNLQPTNVGDSDMEDDFEMDKPMTDTSAFEAQNGKDIQGIPWESMTCTRDKFRETRLKQYNNYVNLPQSCRNVEKECKQVELQSTLYDFQYNTRLVKPTAAHFQLRDLLWATSKNDVYHLQNYSAMHWSSLLRRGKEVLNVAGQTAWTLNAQKCPGSTAQPLARVQISTMTVKDKLMVAGGLQGELICKNLECSGVAFCTKFTNEENNITNAVEIYRTSSGSTGLMVANNDGIVRVFDTEIFACLNHFSFSWPVNKISVSPDGKLIAVLGDNVDSLISDAQSGKVIGCLKGHSDYSFSSSWHPDGRILATGNQDTTCRLWDIRNLSQSFAVLKGRMGAIRTIKFASDGQFMAMAEPADFVHIYDVHSGFNNGQEIDIFGEITGISFSPDTEALFVGITDRTYGSLMEFTRRSHSKYLDTII